MKIRTLFLFFLYVIIVIGLVPVILFCMLFQIREPLYDIGKGTMRFSRKILGLDLDVEGLESLDREKSYIFMANHLSFIDGPLLFLIIPHKVRVIMKKGVARVPVLGVGLKYVGFVPVDRKGAQGGKASISRAARLMKNRGYSFLIFPEGTRSLDGSLKKFRRGGFFLALESGAPIVPIAICGTFGIMPKGSFYVKKGRIRVVFRKAIPVQGYDQNDLAGLMDKVRASILEAANEEER